MIVLRDVVLRRGTKLVLDGASLILNPGEKVGLVGRNGAGKSSLFALLRGELHEDRGEVTVPPHWRVAHVAQDMPETDADATAFVLAGDTRLSDAQAQLRAAEISGDGAAIAAAHAALADAGAHDARARAQALLLGLGFAPDGLEQPVRSFSGGWRMRLQLARALMCPSDALLLDEPTNHLDLDALIWLEGWLQRYAGTLIVISHDREFLDAVTRVTVHLEDGRLTRYGGCLSAFEDWQAQQLAQQHAAYERQQARIAHLQRFVERFRAKATKARQAQSRLKALARMERLAPVLAHNAFAFQFAPAGAMPNPLLILHDVTAGYRLADGDVRPIVRGVRCSVLPGQRIGILGANGQGKSTLVKTLAGVLPPLAGRMAVGRGLRIGYFAQHELDVLRPDETPLQHLQRLARQVEAHGPSNPQSLVREADLRAFLGGFAFSGEMALQPVGSLSGGEKARLALALLVWQRPHLLLLDEPTNHLDLDLRQALAVALNDFDGSVLLVSHDRALLRSVCDGFWLVSEGQLQPFDGDLEDYQRHVLQHARQRREAWRAGGRSGRSEPSPDDPLGSHHNGAASVAEVPMPQTAADDAGAGLTPQERRRRLAQRRQQLALRLRPHLREREAVEGQLQRLQSEQTALQAQLAQPLTPVQRAELGRRLKALESEIAAAEERWLTIAETIEALERDAHVELPAA
ncbi:ABC-F family ATP-binding cassette domain-containing protein [Tepidimonas charontis]|uniref:Probable ATP-binding protein YheS n=1 Tax=Tepidimonas charontis TaxID=2267262 RepID=A0A554XJ83_9BURK|nr:ATP-binding cassette domain-containing protein [Tepidimonas charontis]TSE35882.1 putative ABC transporter ATP-binding protein YheS [Tepidimonas charontis]